MEDDNQEHIHIQKGTSQKTELCPYNATES